MPFLNIYFPVLPPVIAGRLPADMPKMLQIWHSYLQYFQ